MTRGTSDDPRKLRTLVDRAAELARERDVPSVVIGLASKSADRSFPDFVDYLEGSIRVEDGLYRMTRDRVILHLADVEIGSAREVFGRLVASFEEEYPSVEAPNFQVTTLEVKVGTQELSVKEVLKEIFSAPTLH